MYIENPIVHCIYSGIVVLPQVRTRLRYLTQTEPEMDNYRSVTGVYSLSLILDSTMAVKVQYNFPSPTKGLVVIQALIESQYPGGPGQYPTILTPQGAQSTSQNETSQVSTISKVHTITEEIWFLASYQYVNPEKQKVQRKKCEKCGLGVQSTASAMQQLSYQSSSQQYHLQNLKSGLQLTA